MTFTPGSPLNEGDDLTQKDIDDYNERLNKEYQEYTKANEELRRKAEQGTQLELDLPDDDGRTDTIEAQRKGLGLDEDTGKPVNEFQTELDFAEANKGFEILYEAGKKADDILGSQGVLGSVFDYLKGKSEGKDVRLPAEIVPQLLLRQQRDLPKDKTKGLLTDKSSLPAEIVNNPEFPELIRTYASKGLDPFRKNILSMILSRLAENRLDPEGVRAADRIYGKTPRAFFNKRKPDKKGRLYDLATGQFDTNELSKQFPGKRNQTFRREINALAVDERFTTTNFLKNRGVLIDEWVEALEDVQDLYRKNNILDESRDLEAHHIRSIRHMAALFSGMDRKQRANFNRVLLRNSIAVGHNPINVILLGSNKYNNIHKRLHDKLDKKIGKYAEKLIDKNRTYPYSTKVELAKEMGRIINVYTNEAYDEMAEYMEDLTYAANPSTSMGAQQDIAEFEARIDFTFNELDRRLNESGLSSIQQAIDDLPAVETPQEGNPVIFGQEDDPFEPTRLTRGLGKKTLKRLEEIERLYGKQGKLDI